LSGGITLVGGGRTECVKTYFTCVFLVAISQMLSGCYLQCDLDGGDS